jgi:putative membrane protein
MFHFYDGYHFFGMHMLWWAFWVLFIFIMFGAFETTPRKKEKKVE